MHLVDVERKQRAARQELPSLIFDLGLHKGFDSKFYLSKGFRVVGLEADPQLCAATTSALTRKYGDRFTSVNKALSERAGEMAAFFTVPEKDDWGSLTKAAAEKGIYNSIAIQIETTTLIDLIKQFGVPYYIKCDLEGADSIFARQLTHVSDCLPSFVSLEVNTEDDISALMAAGYEVGQIVNQWMNSFTRCPNPAREGVFVDATFNGETSGLFGRELPQRKWRPLEEVRDMYVSWRRLHNWDGELAPGWVDIHVCKMSTIA